MANLDLSARPRAIVGKKVKKLRREGLLPAVVYGSAIAGVRNITLSAREFERTYAHAGTATLLTLREEGARDLPVLVHQVQYDPTRRNAIHVDFYAPNMRQELTVAVPLAFTGEAQAAANTDGIVTHLLTELQVRCLPDRIPAALEVDVSSLTEVGAQLTAGDILLQEGVGLATAAEELVAKVDPAPVVVVDEPETDEEPDAATVPLVGETEEPEPDSE